MKLQQTKLIQQKVKQKQMQKHLKQESRLWDYNINQKIGKGEYGEVFQVVNKISQQVYALKKMPISGSHEKQKIQAFKQIKCLKLLSHPSIIEYKESFLSMENIYIVMEYAANGDFQKIIEEKKKKQKYYTEDELWNIFETLIKGVKYLHEKNIIHRDLKMENIFMTEDGKVKIGDLGMSKIMYKDDQLISTRVGTPIYFAPEIIQNKLYSYPVDIWSLGCIFYYLAMLEHPFQDATIQTLPFYVIDKSPKPIKGQYSNGLISFVNSCLQKESKNRPNIFQLALKLKTKNQDSETTNKVSIFNLRQLTRILNSQQQIFSQRKAQKKGQIYQRFGPKANPISPKRIYSSLMQRPKNPERNLRSSVDQRNFSRQQFLESPESPTFRKIFSANNSKPQIYRQKKSINSNFMQDKISPLIKSSGFSFKIGHIAVSQKTKADHFEQIGMLDLSPEKAPSFKKTISRRSHR